MAKNIVTLANASNAVSNSASYVAVCASMVMLSKHLLMACGRPGLVTEGLWGRFDVLKTPKAESSMRTGTM